MPYLTKITKKIEQACV